MSHPVVEIKNHPADSLASHAVEGSAWLIAIQ